MTDLLRSPAVQGFKTPTPHRIYKTARLQGEALGRPQKLFLNELLGSAQPVSSQEEHHHAAAYKNTSLGNEQMMASISKEATLQGFRSVDTLVTNAPDGSNSSSATPSVQHISTSHQSNLSSTWEFQAPESPPRRITRDSSDHGSPGAIAPATPLLMHSEGSPSRHLATFTTPMIEYFHRMPQHQFASPLFKQVLMGQHSPHVMDGPGSPLVFIHKKDLMTPIVANNKPKIMRKAEPKLADMTVQSSGNTSASNGSISNRRALRRHNATIEISKQSLKMHEISELKQQAAEQLHLGQFQQAIDTANLCYEKIVDTFGPKHLDCVYIKTLLGEAYTHCGGGLFQLAKDAFDDALAIIDNSDPESNFQVKLLAEILYTDVGYLMRLQGKFMESLDAYQKVYQLRLQQYGESSLQVAQTLNHIALVLTSLGKFSEALQMFERARAIRVALLGQNHLDVGTVINNIANVHLYLGRYKSALEHYSQGKAILEENGQQEHPDYATCLVNMGSAYKELRQYEKALVMYEKAQAHREHVLGRFHNLTAATYLLIGQLLLCPEFNAQAVSSSSTPSTRESMNLNASIASSVSYSRAVEEIEEQRAEQFKRAKEYIRWSLEIRSQTTGLFSAETANCYNILGHAFAKEQNFDEAMKCYRTARKICEQLNGQDHPETMQCEENIANLMLITGQRGDEALQMLLKIAQYKRKYHGNSHPCTATMYNSIGNVLRRQGRLEQARRMYDKARVIFEEAYGFEHQSTAIMYTNIGNLYFYEGYFDDALKWYVKAKSIRERRFGGEHIETLSSLKNMALVYIEQERYDMALDLLRKCKDAIIRNYDFKRRRYMPHGRVNQNQSRLVRSSSSSSSSISSQEEQAVPAESTQQVSNTTKALHYLSNGAATQGLKQDRGAKGAGGNAIELEVISLGSLIARVLRIKSAKAIAEKR